MNVQRGDVVLLDYPYASGSGGKVRPALVVQNNRDNQRLTNTIVVQMERVSGRYAVIAICGAAGLATATLIERVET